MLHLVGWLCWGLTSQSTIFQSYRDGAIASWVINQYFRGVKCLAQGHNTAAVGLEARTSRSGVRHSTTEPPRSPVLHLFLWSLTSSGRPLGSVFFANNVNTCRTLDLLSFPIRKTLKFPPKQLNRLQNPQKKHFWLPNSFTVSHFVDVIGNHATLAR